MPQDYLREPAKNPAAIKAKNTLQNFRTPEPERRSAASQLIELILGGRRPPSNLLEKMFTPERPTTVTEGISPRIEMLNSALTQRYPLSAPFHIYQLPDTPDQTNNGLTHGNGSVGIADTVNGKPRKFNDLKATMLHEMSHLRGTEDGFDWSSTPTPKQLAAPVVGADISEAQHLLGTDINLPLEGELLKRELAKRKGKK